MENRRILIVGIGNCGINILEQVARWKLDGVKLLAINTDIESLMGFWEMNTVMTKDTLLLGEKLLNGMGMNGDVKLGKKAVQERKCEIEEKLRGVEEVILISGLGGGTGTSATTKIAEIAKGLGIKIVVMSITPFRFELKTRIEQAERCMKEIKKVADLVLVLPNDILLHKAMEQEKDRIDMKEKWQQMNWDIGKRCISYVCG